MENTLEYRQATADARHPWRALGAAAMIGCGWAIAPLGVFLSVGQPILSYRTPYVVGWCAIVGVLAGGMTIWTLRRRSGAETLLGFFGTYFFSVVCFWIGLFLMEGLEYGNQLTLYRVSFMTSAATDSISLLANLLGYATLFGVVVWPIFYFCRKWIWKLYSEAD